MGAVKRSEECRFPFGNCVVAGCRSFYAHLCNRKVLSIRINRGKDVHGTEHWDGSRDSSTRCELRWWRILALLDHSKLNDAPLEREERGIYPLKTG